MATGIAAWLVSLSLGVVVVAAGPSESERLARASEPETWWRVLVAAGDRQDLEGGLLRAAAYVNLGRVGDAFREAEMVADLEDRSRAKMLVSRYEEASRESPADLVVLNCLAFGYYALGDVAASRATLARVIELDPHSPWPRNLLAVLLFGQEELEPARAAAQAALDLDPSNQYGHLVLAAVYYRQRDYLRFASHLIRAPDAARELRLFLDRRPGATSAGSGAVPR